MGLNFLQTFQFQPIGFIDSCYKDRFAVPRQSGLVKEADATLVLRKDLQPEHSLQGLEQFSHLWLIFVFHQNKTSRYHSKVHPPRLEGQSMGLFATRTPHRPNPIGLSLVELVKIENGVLHLKGVDLLDKTPILDIKPYIPNYESITDAKKGWVDSVSEKKIQVGFTDEAAQVLSQWQDRIHKPGLKELIMETIQLDPRPLVYRGQEGQPSPYRQDHAFRVYDGDIHFRFNDEKTATVFKILSMHN